MDYSGFLFVFIGIITLFVSLAISYELPDTYSTVNYILIIMGFVLIFFGAYKLNKAFESKNCNNCKRDVPIKANVCPYCGFRF